MSEVFKCIFNILTEELGLPISYGWELVALGAIGIIAYKVAFLFVGNLYSSDIIGGSVIGSLIHWLVRFVVFVLVWVVCYLLVIVYRFIKTHLFLMLCIALIFAIFKIAISLILKKSAVKKGD